MTESNCHSLSGKTWFENNLPEFKKRVDALSKKGKTPCLVAVLVGSDKNSEVYVNMKVKACENIGITSRILKLPETISESDLKEEINTLNNDSEVTAYIVQLPLPNHISQKNVLSAIDSNKDADGLTPNNFSALLEGNPQIVPATPLGIAVLLKDSGYDLANKHVVIVGRGITIGRPLAALLSTKSELGNAAVTVVHSGVKDIAHYTKMADVVIAAAGVPSIITSDMVKDGVVLVSAGMTYKEGTRVLLPDIDENCRTKATAMTPRVGGVGPMTIAMLINNTIDIASRS
jgi:methylenetetrahydrofolate dehydrogenase (NADP+)/methenyltetrahydrofolate cyclohydrolase